jgi:pimeloyl-ACP methyl ester carboxylesterase
VYASNLWGDVHWYAHNDATRESVDALVASGWQVVRYDGRGMGSSDRDVTDFSVDARLRDLQAVIDHVGVESFVLYGYNQGGPVAITYSLRYPEYVSHLVLANSFASGSTYYEKIPAMRALLGLRSMAQEQWEFFTLTLASAVTGFTDTARAAKTADLFRSSMSPTAFLSFVEAAEEIDVTDLLPLLKVPTLVVQDTAGFVTQDPSRVLASRIPGARFVVTDDAVRAIDEFLREGGLVPAPVSEAVSPMARPGLPSGTGATMRVPSGSVHTFAAGRYTVTRLLGEGAQKIVYLVHDAALERDCALALLKTEVLDADSLARVRREGQAMARLAHPNVVTVHDIGDEAGRPYLVCEYVPGGDLRQELDGANGPLPLPRALAIAGDVCRALAFAHSQGIIHRDVKPGNVHLAGDGSAKLGDFGLALAADQSRLTMPGTAMGTAPYMAPEQARGQPVDARSDLYSLGCLLYELITGRPPFTGDDPMAVVSQHVHAVPEPPSHHNAEVSRDLERLVLALLAKAREERPSSADEALAELKRIAAEH